jgi:hypothetical protein
MRSLKQNNLSPNKQFIVITTIILPQGVPGTYPLDPLVNRTTRASNLKYLRAMSPK